MTEEEKWRIARIALETVGDKYDYALAGSMALRAHGLADRPVDDIDLFNMPDIGEAAVDARAEVVTALTDAGYHVEVEKVWALDQAANLSVSDLARPWDEPVTIQMVPMEMHYFPSDLDGIRVMSVQDCVQMKAEAVGWRTEAKDYVDLSEMNAVLGAEVVDEYLAANPNPAPEVVFRSQLGKVAEIPDEKFAAYDLGPDRAAEVRQNILAWASEIAPARPNPLAVEATGPAAGVQALLPEQAEAAADRIADASPQSLMTDHELMVTAGKTRQLADTADAVAAESEHEAASMRASYEETGGGSMAAELREMGADDAMVARASNSEREDVERKESRAGELRGQASELREQSEAAKGEVDRRSALSPDERAAETVIRREITGQVAAQVDPTRASVVARATATASHQQAARM
ncbi:nucleotidyl transferase AbiEii/AbiGii toxin family protein [Streptomyces sp. NPDC056883]|uniref:nucleotidyl transferase AbiEii/AbiGii toxin family protein n=1 Tax=Streptomyces sp. NPDC056883 TaxID=3345959 RepID=UPI0036A7AD0E